MSRRSIRPSAPPLPVPSRRTSWQAPTGRYVDRGQVVRIKGQAGTWKFLAYVESAPPHVEVRATNGPSSVRAFDPSKVYGVSKRSVR